MIYQTNTVHLWRVRERWWERGHKENVLLEFWRYPEDTYADDEFYA
jgi:hypothetical protein